MAPAPPLLPPTRSAAVADFEYSVHTPPRALIRDAANVFPRVPLRDLLLVPTFQRARLDLLEFGDAQAAEKDRLLVNFLEWAARVRDAVRAVDPTLWVDATDPASGRAHFGTPASCYSDVSGVSSTLRYPTEDAGGCRVLRHPQWGFAVYPATLFSTAPPEVLLAALEKVNAAE